MGVRATWCIRRRAFDRKGVTYHTWEIQWRGKAIARPERALRTEAAMEESLRRVLVALSGDARQRETP